MSICPALKRVEGGFLCEYAGKPIDPFDWHCVGDYQTCPIYVERQKPAVEPAAERRSVTEGLQSLFIKPLVVEPITTSVEGPKGPIGESAAPSVEDLVKSVADNIARKYEELAKKLDESWRSYEAAVLSYRRQWEVEKLRLRRSLDLLSSTISNYERALNELDLKRDLMPEDQYGKAKRELELELGVLRTALDILGENYGDIEDGMNRHLKRVLATSTEAEAINLRLSLSRLDDLLKEGKISREAYERLKKELGAVAL